MYHTSTLDADHGYQATLPFVKKSVEIIHCTDVEAQTNQPKWRLLHTAFKFHFQGHDNSIFWKLRHMKYLGCHRWV